MDENEIEREYYEEKRKQEQRENLERSIRNAINKLDSSTSATGDWKIIKCYEYALQGKELPYDLPALMKERQKIRAEINELQMQYEKLLKEDF